MDKRNVAILVLVLVLIFFGYQLFGKGLGKSISVKEAQAKVQELIDMNPDNTAVIKSIAEEGGVYKVTVTLGEQEFYSYLSKDGKKFFPEAIDLEELSKTQGNATPETGEVSTKSSKPLVELFVMSHCPFGTQVEKGILPVIETLGDKIDFELKFCDYAMHDKTELDEQLKQYCIKEQDKEKLLTYLNCFLAKGDTTRCLSEINIDNALLQNCIQETDNTYKVTANYNDKTTWTQSNPSYPTFDVYKADNLKYNIGGSPTLVVNGEEITTGRDANSLLATICSAFENLPQECEQELSSEIPSPGFGYTTTETATDATCN